MRVLIAAAMLIFSCALANDAPAQELYENKTLGLSVQKPAGWFFATDKQKRENIARSKLNDAEFQSYVQKNSTAPIFMITKYRMPYDDLNPSVKITVRPAVGVNRSNLPAVAKNTAALIAEKIGEVDAI